MSRSGSSGSGIVVPALLGTVAFLVGYGITYLVGRGDVESAMREDGFLTLSGSGGSIDVVASDFQGGEITPPETHNVVGWAFFDLHGIDLDGEMTISGTGDVSETIDVSLAFSLDSWLVVVPPLAIAACGYYAAQRIDPDTPRAAVMAGAKVTAGYVVAVGVAALAFQWGQAGVESGSFGYAQYTIRFGPALSASLLVAGVGYPAVFGAAGGYAAYERSSSAGTAARNGPASGPRPPADGHPAGRQRGSRDRDANRRRDGRRSPRRAPDRRRGRGDAGGHARRGGNGKRRPNDRQRRRRDGEAEPERRRGEPTDDRERDAGRRDERRES